MMEFVTGKNPFKFRTPEQIIAIHDEGELQSGWHPGLAKRNHFESDPQGTGTRFQTMREFAEALEAKHVPLVLNKEMIKAGNIAREAEELLGKKK